MFRLVAGVSRRKLCVVFDPYPLGRVVGWGAGNRGAHVLNSGLPTVRRKLHQRLWLRPKRAVPTQRRTVSRGLVSLYAGQSGDALGSVAVLVAFVGTCWWRARTGTRPSPSLSWRERCPSWSRPGRRGWSCSAAICRSACSPWDGSCLGRQCCGPVYVSARGRRTAHGQVGSCVLPVSLHCHPFRPGGGLDGFELVVGEGHTGRATRTRAMRVAQETISPKRSSPVRR